MRRVTPRATPVVSAPSVLPHADAPLGAAPLVAPVTIIAPNGEHDLAEGALVVGRLPESGIAIEHELVSRVHARIRVEQHGVTVEDLHSTNGVYVNGVRIAHKALLREGDRVLIGTTELSLFKSGPRASVRPLRRSPDKTPTLPAPPLVSPAAPALVPPLPTAEPLPTLGAAARKASEIPATARADALKIVASLAQRLAAAGNVEEAHRVLSSHLKRVLQGANAGLTVPEDLCTLAAQQAMELARWTRQAVWLDYAVELHLSAKQVMAAQVIATFESVERLLGTCDRLLLQYYVESLTDRRQRLTDEEQHRLARLSKLLER